MRQKARRGKWLGGYVRFGSKSSTYVIDKWIGGVHFHVSTRCSTERAAVKQLERFEADPYGYTPLGDDGSALRITLELSEQFRAFMQRKGNSAEWVATVMRFLADWEEDIRTRDLRNLSVQRDLKPALDVRKTSRRHRIETIRSFCRWLREEKGLLTRGKDATLDLSFPKTTAAKLRRRRAVTLEHVRAVFPHLPEETRDVLWLLTGTAWHVSEVRRFAEGGEIVRQLEGDPRVVLVTRHKSGELTRTPLTDRGQMEAAERIRKRGRIPAKETLAQHMRDGCNAVREKEAENGVAEENLTPHFRLGDMRHTALTYGVQQGASPQEASEFAHHRSLTTTKKFYIDLAVPTVSIPTMRLVKEGA